MSKVSSFTKLGAMLCASVAFSSVSTVFAAPAQTVSQALAVKAIANANKGLLVKPGDLASAIQSLHSANGLAINIADDFEALSTGKFDSESFSSVLADGKLSITIKGDMTLKVSGSNLVDGARVSTAFTVEENTSVKVILDGVDIQNSNDYGSGMPSVVPQPMEAPGVQAFVVNGSCEVYTMGLDSKIIANDAFYLGSNGSLCFADRQGDEVLNLDAEGSSICGSFVSRYSKLDYCSFSGNLTINRVNLKATGGVFVANFTMNGGSLSNGWKDVCSFNSMTINGGTISSVSPDYRISNFSNPDSENYTFESAEVVCCSLTNQGMSSYEIYFWPNSYVVSYSYKGEPVSTYSLTNGFANAEIFGISSGENTIGDRCDMFFDGEGAAKLALTQHDLTLYTSKGTLKYKYDSSTKSFTKDSEESKENVKSWNTTDGYVFHDKQIGSLVLSLGSLSAGANLLSFDAITSTDVAFGSASVVGCAQDNVGLAGDAVAEGEGKYVLLLAVKPAEGYEFAQGSKVVIDDMEYTVFVSSTGEAIVPVSVTAEAAAPTGFKAVNGAKSLRAYKTLRNNKLTIVNGDKFFDVNGRAVK